MLHPELLLNLIHAAFEAGVQVHLITLVIMWRGHLRLDVRKRQIVVLDSVVMRLKELVILLLLELVNPSL